MAIPYIGQGEQIKASWLNQIVDGANGPDIPYDGSFTGTPKGTLLMQRPLASERPEAQNPDIIFTTRVVPNCYPLTAYPFEYETEEDADENHIFVNLGRSFQQLRASIQINGEPVNQFVLLAESGTPEALVLSGPQDASLSDDNLSSELWLPAESQQLSAVADCNTGWVDTGFNGDSGGGGIYLVVASVQNEEDDKPKSVAVITDIEAKRPEDAEAVLAELDSQGIIAKDDVTAVPIAEAMGGWTLSAEWGDGNYGQNGAHVWNCYTVGTQRATVGETPEDTMKPELKQMSVQRKHFSLSSESEDEGEEPKTQSVFVRQLYNFNKLSSMDFPKLDVDQLSGLHWVLRLHKDDDEEGGEEETPARSLKKGGIVKAGAEPAQEGEGEEGDEEEQANKGTTKIVYSSVIHPDSFKGTNGISSLEYCDYSDSDIEYSLFKFKDMDTVAYDPESHDILVRNHDGTLEYTDSIGILGDASTDGADTKSIETIYEDEEAEDPGPRMHTFYRFKDLQYYREPLLGLIADGQQHRLLDGLGIDIVVRDTENKEVAYLDPFYTLPDVDSLSDDVEDLSGDVSDISSIVEYLRDEITGLSGDWWPKGGSYNECYGNSIGNRLQSKVIDLNELVLLGDWLVSGDLSVTGNLVVDLSSSLHNTAVNGDLTVTGDESISGDLSVGGDLYVPNGTMHLNDIECQNLSAEFIYAVGAEVSGILSAESLEGEYCTVDNFEALSSFAVGAPVANFAGDMLVGGDATFYSHASFGDSVDIVNDLEVNGTADFVDAVTMGEDLDVTGAVVCGSLSATGGSVTIGSTTLDEQTLQDLIALLNQQRSLRSVPLENVKFSTQLLVDQPESQLSGT